MAGVSIREECRQWNAASEQLWDQLTPQRQRLTSLAAATLNVPDREEPIPPGGSLAVLGAGNCNDLDLAALAPKFERIDLIDLDSQALEYALERAFGDDRPAHVRAIGDVDLTGLGKRPRNAPPVPEKAAGKLLGKLAKHRIAEVSDQYDRVVSSSMIGAIVANVAMTMGQKHKKFREAANAARDGHLQQIVDLLKPGGYGMLALEFASSDIVDELHRYPEEQLMPLFEQLLGEGKFFQGCNPNAIAKKLQATGQVIAVNGLTPWRYRVGPRVFLVYGVTFLKKPEGWVAPAEAEQSTEPTPIAQPAHPEPDGAQE
ncbi:MAG: hypothetical protein KAS72_12005 [Phycisphaerales bacterium]|nr:hypothetical protein [Phycisphaerales bacterium]